MWVRVPEGEMEEHMKRFDEHEAGVWAAVMVAVLLLKCTLAFSEPLPAPETSAGVVVVDESFERDVAAVEAYIRDFVAMGRSEERAARDRRWVKIPLYARLIVEHARQFGVDPLLVAVICKRESSFKVRAKGARKERGLMQVMPGGVASKDDKGRPYDLSTINGQLSAGANHLQRCLRLCRGNVRQALRAYQHSGGCHAQGTGADRRYREYKRKVAKFRTL